MRIDSEMQSRRMSHHAHRRFGVRLKPAHVVRCFGGVHLFPMRFALHRYFLFLLQEKELIMYQTAKTNYQYAFELAGSNLHKPFIQLTREYEYAWYGGFAIEKAQFDRYYELVSKLKNELN